MNFKQYKRKGLSEMVSVTEFTENGGDLSKVSISSPDHLLQTHNPDEFNVATNGKGAIKQRCNAFRQGLWYLGRS